MKKIRAVIFDCDGVMFDTRELNRIYYNKILDHFGMPGITDTQLEKAHMDTSSNAIKFLFEGRQDLEKAYKFATTISYSELVPLMMIEPNLVNLLTILKKSGKITAIATNRTTTMPLVISHYGLDGFFDMIVTSVDVKNPKPAPDQLFKIMDAFGLEPSESIYIGDSLFDQMAADSAGVEFISFRNPGLKSSHNIESLDAIENMI